MLSELVGAHRAIRVWRLGMESNMNGIIPARSDCCDRFPITLVHDLLCWARRRTVVRLFRCV